MNQQEAHISKKVEELVLFTTPIISIQETICHIMNNSLKLVSKLIMVIVQLHNENTISQDLEKGIQVKVRHLNLLISTFLIWIQCLHKDQELEHWCQEKLRLLIGRIVILLKILLVADNFMEAHR